MNFASLKLIAIIAGLSLLIVGATYLYKQNYQKNQQSKSNVSVKDNNTKIIPTTKNDKIPALPASASAKALDQYVVDVQAQAEEIDTLKFSQCTADPAVFKIKDGTSFKIQNNDQKDILINIGKSQFKVEAGKTNTVKMDAEPSIYRYSCIYTSGDGGINKEAGVAEVTK